MLSIFVVLLLAISSVQGGKTVPEQVNHAVDIGLMESDRKLDIMVVLNINNKADLDNRLQRIYDPKSSQYRKFMTTKEYIFEYCPTVEQVNQTTSYLSSVGIQVTSVSSNRLLIKGQGSVGTLNSMLHTDVHYYRYQGNNYFAPAHEFQLPNGLSIQAVYGLQNFSRYQSFAHRLNSRGKQPAKPGIAVTPDTNLNNGYFGPGNIITAYNMPTAINAGAGQNLALFELDGYTASDIAYYAMDFAINPVSLYNVLIDGATGIPGSSADKVTLDIELMNGIVPGASGIYVYEGPNTEQGILDTYNQIATDNIASQISSSWGSPENSLTESFIESEYIIFYQFSVQGQSFYASSGDGGAYDGSSYLSVNDPASQPWVVGVGGTTITVDDSSYVSETTWNDLSTGGGASGGGFSSYWSQPSWQVGANPIGGSPERRNVPDVSLNAESSIGYWIYFSGEWYVYGGTGCAAPIWAAFNALINQQLLLYGLSPIGFPNPIFYQIGMGASYDSCFHDINDGSTNGWYTAGLGYDDCTGWGSMNGEGIIEYITPVCVPEGTCDSYTSCKGNSQCFCGISDIGSICYSNDPCDIPITCSSTNDCPSGSYCLLQSCCGNVCAQLCPASTSTTPSPTPSAAPPPTSDPTCQYGILGTGPDHSSICCTESCGVCGGTGCELRPGGGKDCCTISIFYSGVSCENSLAPCIISGPSGVDPTCQNGIKGTGPDHSSICCAEPCGVCGGAGCGLRPGGAKECCPLSIFDAGVTCETSAAPCIIVDPTCQNGIKGAGPDHSTICCAESCGVCGGTGCGSRPGGSTECCTESIFSSGISCQNSVAPCIVQ
jgi:kumamolisin